MPTPGQELASIDFASMLGGPLIAAVNAQAQAAMSAVNFIKEVGFKKISDEQDPTASQTGDPIYVAFKYPKEIAPFMPADTGVTLTLTSGGSGYTTAPTVTIAAPSTGGIQATATTSVDAAGAVVGLVVTNPGRGYTSAPSVTFGGPGSGAAATAAIIRPNPVPAQIQQMKLEVPILTMLPIPYLRIDDVTIDFNAKINSVEYQKIDTSLKVDAALEAKARWGWGSAKLNVSMSYQRSTQQGVSVDRTYSMTVHIKAVQDETPGGMEKILSILEREMREQPALAPAPVSV